MKEQQNDAGSQLDISVRRVEEQTDVPIRIQRKRTKGWRMPPNAVYVGRPTCWGNPYVITPGITREEAVERYRRSVTMRAGTVGRIKDHLRGKDIACWCALDQPCHADVLLKIANEA